MNKRKQYPSQERLRELFDYDPEGFLVWRHRPEKTKNWNGKFAGTRADQARAYPTLHRTVTIDGYVFDMRRLVWIYHNGSDVTEGEFIKSKGNIFYSVKIEDLYISKSKTKTNHGHRIHKQSGAKFKGVKCIDKSRFVASTTENTTRYIGTFATKEAAAAAYNAWAKKHYGEGFIFNDVCQLDYENLRLTKSGQQDNKGKGFKGVWKKRDKWVAEFSFKGKKEKIGTYKSKYDAARAYNIKAKEVYGERAIINEVENPFRPPAKEIRKAGTGLMGVYEQKSRRFTARFKKRNLGTFDTKEQAARAYNRAARDHYGEHAVLNDVPDPFGEDQDLPF